MHVMLTFNRNCFCNSKKQLLRSARTFFKKRLKAQHLFIVILFLFCLIIIIIIKKNGGIRNLETIKNGDLEDSDFLVEIDKRKFYFGLHDYVTWYDAKVKCDDLGMQLVTLGNRRKYFKIMKWLRENPVYDDWLWTAGFKSSMTSQWHWVTSRANFSYTSWGFGQPSRSYLVESCMDFSFKSMGWEDDRCNDILLSYLCEEESEG